jgi:hypothetical protein
MIGQEIKLTLLTSERERNGQVGLTKRVSRLYGDDNENERSKYDV